MTIIKWNIVANKQELSPPAITIEHARRSAIPRAQIEPSLATRTTQFARSGIPPAVPSSPKRETYRSPQLRLRAGQPKHLLDEIPSTCNHIRHATPSHNYRPPTHPRSMALQRLGTKCHALYTPGHAYCRRARPPREGCQLHNTSGNHVKAPTSYIGNGQYVFA